MDNTRIIENIKNEAIETMKERKILSSFIISTVLTNLDGYDDSDIDILLNAKNVMLIKAGSKYNADCVYTKDHGVRYKSYSSLQENINEWLCTFKSSNIKELWDIDKIISTLGIKKDISDKMHSYIAAYRLGDIDTKVLDELYPSNQTIVEVSVSQSTDFYQEFSGYKSETTNSPINKVPSVKPAEIKPVQLVTGEKIYLRNANIFKQADDCIACRSYTGNAWIYNGVDSNGKFAITTNKNNLGKGRDYIDGYAYKLDILSSGNL